MVRVTGVEPARLAALDPKSSASANSATPANIKTTTLIFRLIIPNKKAIVKSKLRR